MTVIERALVVGLLCAGPGMVAVTAQEASGPPLEMSLADAIGMSLQNNLDIKVASYDPQQRQQDVIFQQAAFDPNVGGYAEKQDNRFPTALRTVGGVAAGTQIEASEDIISVFAQKENNIGFGFQDPLAYGATYSARIDTTRRVTSSADAILPVQYETALTLAYNQSLLRNGGSQANKTQIVIAQANEEISRNQYKDQVLRTLQATEDAFWELVFARDDLEVKTESLRLAEELLKLNRIKVDVGTLPPIEITQAEAEVANREQGVIVAENSVRNAEDTLRQVINMPKEERNWWRPIIPTDEPVFVEREVDLQKSFEEALANRPDLEQSRLEISNSDTQLAFDKNQRKWDLRLNANYVLRGLSGDDPSVLDPNTFMPVTTPIDEDYTESFEQLFDLDNFNSWLLGLNLNIPLGNNGADARYVASRLAKEQSEIRYENAKLAAAVEVRTAARSILTDRKRIEAAEKNVELQRKKVEAEQKKFENGMSTSFQVLEFQEDLTTALGEKNRALIDYRKSITFLERAKGTLHEYLNVTMGY